MRIEEAKYIRKTLDKLPNTQITPCINLGSSTEEYRKTISPHIDQELIAPLLKKTSIIHIDMKEAEGVDYAGDIYAQSTQQFIQNKLPKLILCCNIFEHVTDRKLLATILTQITPNQGYLLISVPYSYPLHMDPIDTYYRPTPKDILELFPEFQYIQGDIIKSSSYAQDIYHAKNKTAALRKLLKRCITAFFPIHWKKRNHRLLWLFRSYRISVVLLRKNG